MFPLKASFDSIQGWLRHRRGNGAALIRRIFEVDPVVCPRCGEAMRIIAFITEAKVIRKILRHLETKAAGSRDPPPDAGTAAA